MRNNLIPVKGHFRTETSSLALYWCLFLAPSFDDTAFHFVLATHALKELISHITLQTAEGFLIHFTTLHPKSAAFTADPRLILFHTPRWARLTYDSVSLLEHGCAIFSLLFGTSESFVIKVLMFDCCVTGAIKSISCFLGGVLTPQPGELQLWSAKTCFVFKCAFFRQCKSNYRTEMDTFTVIALPFLFLRPCPMPPFISWSVCWDECLTSKVNVKLIVQWDDLGLRPRGSTTYKREHLILECILGVPSPNVHDSIKHPLVQRQSSLYQ